MSYTPLTFTGVSSYSTDFQTILSRAVSIATLPVTQLENQQADIVSEKVLATNLNDAVATLATKVKALGKLGTSQALSATSTDSDKVTATVSGTASPAYYAITNVTSIAQKAAETSLNSFTSSETTDTSFTLTVGTETYDITLGSGENTLAGLRDAINDLGAGVTATVLTTSEGNYLSVSADSAGATTLSLKDSTEADFLTSTNQGADTVFELNGVSVTSSSATVNDVIPGVILDFADVTDTGETVGITLSSNRDTIESALEDLVSYYNEVADQVNAQIGEDAGLLSGNNIIRQVRTAMMSIMSYSGGDGEVTSLAALGIEIDSSGEMSFDSTVLDGLSDSQVSGAFSFFGSESTGFGAVAKNFTEISDPISGAIKMQLDMWEETNDRITEQIDTLNERISLMEESLNTKLEMADALLASLESEQSLLNASIESLDYTTYGKNEDS